MSTIHRFEEIDAWQTARQLTKAVYALAASGSFTRDYLESLPKHKRFASPSQPSNLQTSKRSSSLQPANLQTSKPSNIPDPHD